MACQHSSQPVDERINAQRRDDIPLYSVLFRFSLRAAALHFHSEVQVSATRGC